MRMFLYVSHGVNVHCIIQNRVKEQIAFKSVVRVIENSVVKKIPNVNRQFEAGRTMQRYLICQFGIYIKTIIQFVFYEVIEIFGIGLRKFSKL